MCQFINDFNKYSETYKIEKQTFWEFNIIIEKDKHWISTRIDYCPFCGGILYDSERISIV